MLITFKTITQKQFQMELEDSVEIGDLRKRISTEHGEEEYYLETLKLIYDGKVLNDKDTVGSLKYDEKKFVVVMNPKKKPPPKPVEQPAPPKTTAPVVNEPSTSATSTPTQQSTTTTAATTATPTSTTPSAESAQPSADAQDDVPAEHKDTLEAIVSMGYDRAQAVTALRAAYYNADRAVEYLITGIPTSGGANDVQGMDDEMQGLGENELSFLNSPQFEELRQIVLENPAALPQIMQEIQTLNPDLLAFIRDNQQMFLDRLNSSAVGSAPADEDMEQGEVPVEGAGQQGGQPDGGILEGARTVSVSLTADEQAAIDRMKAMGFPENLIIEAYLACDRNEDLAINYILTHLDEQDGN